MFHTVARMTLEIACTQDVEGALCPVPEFKEPTAVSAPPVAPAAAEAQPAAATPAPATPAPATPGPATLAPSTDTPASMAAIPIVAPSKKTPGACLIVEVGTSWSSITHVTYDRFGNVLRTFRRDIGQNRYVDEVSTYDARGKLVQKTMRHPGGSKTTTYTLDAAGRPTVVSEGTDYRTVIDYDGSGRKIREKSSSVATGITVLDDVFAYDGQGRLSKRTGLGYVIDYTSGKDGRLLHEVRDSNDTYTTTYRYDASGNKTGSDVVNSKGKNSSHQVFTYDAFGNMLTEFRDIGEGYRSNLVYRHVCQGKTAMPPEVAAETSNAR